MKDSVPIALEAGSDGVFGLGTLPAPRFGGERGMGRQPLALARLYSVPNPVVHVVRDG
jgi:hypothetical protein